MGIHDYDGVIMGAMAYQITGITIAYSSVYSGALKKTSKLRVTGLCEMNSPVTGDVSIWWRHHVFRYCMCSPWQCDRLPAMLKYFSIRSHIQQLTWTENQRHYTRNKSIIRLPQQPWYNPGEYGLISHHKPPKQYHWSLHRVRSWNSGMHCMSL